jgi:hypothetical protein
MYGRANFWGERRVNLRAILPLCLIKRQVIKTCVGMEAYNHTFVTLVLDIQTPLFNLLLQLPNTTRAHNIKMTQRNKMRTCSEGIQVA